MDKSGTNGNKPWPSKNQRMLLNATDLKRQIQDYNDQCRRLSLVGCKDIPIKNNKLMSEEDNMAYSFSSILGYRLNDICNVFKEKKFIQNVLPTRFTQQDSTANSCDISGVNKSEEIGIMHYLHLHSNHSYQGVIKLTHLWSRLSNILYLYHIDHSLATIVQLNIYRLTDSQLGFYHTGLEFRNREYTYCFDTGIIYHPPRRCKFAIFLGTVTLGPVLASYDQFWDIMRGNVNNKILKKYSPALKLIKFISLNRLI